VLAFVCFSLCASAGYVLNDLLDLQADRQHPTKRHRPFASGALPVSLGVALTALLLALGLGLGFLFAAPSFLSVLGVYLVTSVTYSVFLKRQLLIDVIVLAGLYTLRVIAGGAAVSIELTPWLLAFSLFIFLSLAFAKRYSELALAATRQQEQLPRRAYQVGDLDLVLIPGSSSGYLSVLVLCLYINSDLVGQLYQTPEMLWLLCPILLYWVGRVWFLAKRGELPGDPVAFAVRDTTSYLLGLLALAVIGLAIL
jgi:4-hydroxybenzoate polyprenyltransferase